MTTAAREIRQTAKVRWEITPQLFVLLLLFFFSGSLQLDQLLRLAHTYDTNANANGNAHMNCPRPNVNARSRKFFIFCN